MNAAEVKNQFIINENPYIVIRDEVQYLTFFIGKLSMSFESKVIVMWLAFITIHFIVDGEKIRIAIGIEPIELFFLFQSQHD